MIIPLEIIYDNIIAIYLSINRIVYHHCYFYKMVFQVIWFSRFSTNNTTFLGCSGPLDNARTIPEWLKNNLKKIEKMLFFLNKIISK